MPSPVELSIARLIDVLEGVRPNGYGYTARCPNHKDRSPSLSINPGEKGWLVHCHAGCNIIDVLSHGGLSVRDLFYDSGSRPTETAVSGLRDLIRRTTPVYLWGLERFDDVAWVMWPHRFEEFVLAAVDYQDVVNLPFTEAMKQWTVIRDGFLWNWLGHDIWLQARETAARKLWATYNNQPVS